MEKEKTKKPLLFFIVIIAFVLRFYKLGEIPPSINWDEAALGYNAFSIAETGRDEHGVLLPLQYFASFGDYKPPVYIYFVVPIVKLFGLTAWSVRFPSALFGAITVLLTYFLAKELLEKKGAEEDFKVGRFRIDIPLISSFFLAVSPWHVQISRGAFEANLSTFWIVLGIWLFIRGINKNPKLIIFSIVSFVISLYTFNSARLFTPILIVGSLLIYARELLKVKKWVFIAGVISFLLLTPLIPHLLSKEGKLRFNEVTIFTDLDVIKTSNARIETDGNTFFSKIIHNRRIGYSLLFAKHYFDEFDPEFLFINGDINPKFSLRDVGELYLIDIPLLLAGFYVILKNRTKHLTFLVFWFLISPIPAATARETPHALRSLTILPTFQIVSAMGLFFLLESFMEKKTILSKFKMGMSSLLFFSIAFLFMIQFLYFQHNYYSHYSNEFSQDWQYGYKEIVPLVSSIQDNYDRIWISSAYGRPYIFFLFYNRTDPKTFWKYQDQVTIDNFGFFHVLGFDKYYFGYPQDIKEHGRFLYAGVPADMPPDTNIIKEFKFLNGETAFEIGDKTK